MDELRRRGDEERVGFELQLAGARNVKAARALLADHDNNIEKLKAAEPWLFSAPAAPAPTGATGLPSAGAAGADESTQMSRWRKIAGLPESEERAAAGGSGRARRAGRREGRGQATSLAVALPVVIVRGRVGEVLLFHIVDRACDLMLVATAQ